ncbi:protease inhibitor I42 family protein [Streptomyces sp. NPDC048581]|jgi:inhibitor of cysteine peptidase|uniref:protease inhibitor I42 family protein n=1 Tax=unclassified Streptomyces TaxID=2593676 RepID=UPI0037101E20
MSAGQVGTGYQVTAGIRTALVALPLVALAGCGLIGPASYGTDERKVTVDAGDEFTLDVPASPSLGENWYLAEPRPDPAVLRYENMSEDIEGDDEGVTGSGSGTQHFEFTAVAPGTTTVKLLYCPHGLCHSAAEVTASPSPGSSASPLPVTAAETDTPDDTDDPTYYLYTITVSR